jgi:hypothetical protein
MSKKLKLTLLMSGVMFFPKGAYAVDQDEELKTVASRPASSHHQPASSLLPTFMDEQNADVQPSVAASSSQVACSSSEVDSELDELHDSLTKTRKGWDLYAELLQSNIETNIDLTKYFNFGDIQGHEEAGKTLSIVMDLLQREVEKPLEDIEKKQKELTKLIFNDQKETELYLSVRNQLDELLDDKMSIEDFHLSCSDMLKNSMLQGSKVYSFVNLIQQGKVVGDFFQRVGAGEHFTEATLVNIIKETPENSKNIIERMARASLKMENIIKSIEQAVN